MKWSCLALGPCSNLTSHRYFTNLGQRTGTSKQYKDLKSMNETARAYPFDRRQLDAA